MGFLEQKRVIFLQPLILGQSFKLKVRALIVVIHVQDTVLRVKLVKIKLLWQ